MTERLASALYFVPRGSTEGCSMWRAWRPVTVAKAHGARCDWAYMGDARASDHVLGYDALVFQRMGWSAVKEGQQFMRELHAAGRVVLAEYDDDIWTNRGDQKSERELGFEDGNELSPSQCRRSTKLYDGLIVSTERLRTVVHGFAPDMPVEVVGNYIDLGLWRELLAGQERHPKLAGKRTIGWFGGNRKGRDLAVMAEAWRRVAVARPDVVFVVQGYLDDVIRDAVPKERLEVIGWLPVIPRDGLPFYGVGLLNIDVACCSVAETAFNAAKCVTGDTLVYTRQGAIPIAELSPTRGTGIINPVSLSVMTTGGYRMATEFYSGGEQDIVTMTTTDGFQVSGTPNHPIRRANSEWAMLGDLAVGDEVRIIPMPLAENVLDVQINLWAGKRFDRDEPQRHAPSLPRVRVDENIGALMGYILGDGNIGKNSIRISCDPQDVDVIADIQGLADAIGLKSSTKYSNRVSPLTNRGVLDVLINSARFNDYLRNLGLIRDGRKFFRVPWAIYRSPKPVVRAFLRTLFEADGTAGGTAVSLTSKEEELARGVLLLLTAFGIRAKLVRRWNSAYQRNYYQVSLGRDACDVFAREIGFVGSRKAATLAGIVGKPHSNALKPMKWSDTVASLTRGRGDVFDLTVPDGHEFAANGLMCHNTPIKVLEATAAGAAVVVSSWLYGRTVDHGADGFIADTADEWEAALLRLIDDEPERKRMHAAMYAKIAERLSLEVNWWRFPAAWTALVNEARARAGRTRVARVMA